jgi:hypothetical protein
VADKWVLAETEADQWYWACAYAEKVGMQYAWSFFYGDKKLRANLNRVIEAFYMQFDNTLVKLLGEIATEAFSKNLHNLRKMETM